MKRSGGRRWGLLLLMLAGGCATHGAFEQGQVAAQGGRWEEALPLLEQAARENPTKPQYRAAYIRTRDLALGQLLAEADYALNAGELDLAQARLNRALGIDPHHSRALTALTLVQAERRQREQVAAAERLFAQGELAGAEAALRPVLAHNPNQREARALMRRIAERQAAAQAVAVPSLGASFQKPVSLEFREASMRAVFELLSRTSGVNFVFDRDVRPDLRVTIFVRDTSIDDVIKLILATNQLERKVLSPNVVLIYPNTPAKAREYVDLVTRSFYLGNADPKQTLNMIRTIVKTRDVYIDEKLNLLVMRDTPGAVRMAEKLVAMQDLAEPEVTLEVEVLEVSRSRALELGIRFPDKINFGPLGDAAGGAPAAFAFSRGALTASVANPAFVINLRQQEGLANVLANPRIRVRNREKARIHIGEKVPVVTTTSTANVGVSASVSYLEVGLKLDVEPNVYLDDEIAIKVALEVSNIIETIDLLNTRAYRLGTRNAATTLRLRDGETQVLAGLIQDEDRRTASKVPGLGELPVVGRLFTSNNDQTAKTEIVLLITPRVVRNVVRPEAYAAEFFSGTEAAAGAPPLRLGSGPGASIALSSSQGGAAPTGSAAPLPGALLSMQPPAGATTTLVPPIPTSALLGAQPAAPPLPASSAAQGNPAALIFGAPGQAVLGKDLAVTLGVPATANVRSIQADIYYDPSLFEVASPAPGSTNPSVAITPREPGRVTVRIENPNPGGAPPAASVQLRAIGKERASTQLVATNITVEDLAGRSLPGDAPPARTVVLVPQ